MNSNLRRVLATIALACAPGAAMAQSPSPIVPPDRPDQTPVQAPPTGQVPATTQQPTALQQVAPFQLQAVEVSGSSLAPEVLKAAWQPFIGQSVGSSGIASITDAVVKAYERSDIALYTVLVPSQSFADGVLRITVLEGYVESVDVKGAPEARARDLVQRDLDQLKQERPLRKSTLQRYVSLARDVPGIRSDIRFVTGTQTSAVGVVADLDANPVQLGVSINNRGAALLGRTQVAADLLLNNLIADGQTRLSVAVPTDLQRFQYVGLSQSQVLGTSGATAQVSLGYLRTRPRGSDLEGDAVSAGVQFTYPLLRSYERDLYVTAGFDGLNASSVFVGSAFSDDRTRAARLSLFFAQQAPRSRLSLSLAGSQGLDILGAQTLVPDSTELNYFKLNARLTYAREVVDRVFLRLAAAGQWSRDRLPASEQFGLGGNEFGRGFEAAALTGDQGYAGSAELAFRPTGLPSLVQDGEAYGFVDAGETYLRGRPFAARAQDDLSSIGAGVRATYRGRLALQLEATTPLSASLPTLQNRGSRLVFSVRSVW